MVEREMETPGSSDARAGSPSWSRTVGVVTLVAVAFAAGTLWGSGRAWDRATAAAPRVYVRGFCDGAYRGAAYLADEIIRGRFPGRPVTYAVIGYLGYESDSVDELLEERASFRVSDVRFAAEEAISDFVPELTAGIDWRRVPGVEVTSARFWEDVVWPDTAAAICDVGAGVGVGAEGTTWAELRDARWRGP